MTNQNLYNPFRKLKVRNLVLRNLLITFCLGFVAGIMQEISGLKFNAQFMTLIFYILSFGLLCLWELADFKSLGINLKYVVGDLPNNYKWLPIIGLVMLLLLFSLSAYLVSFYLVSLVAPDFIEQVMRQAAKDPSPNSSAPALYNLLAISVYVVFAPLAEEFLFRGIILQRWAAKWGIRTALVVSSLLFGILHLNVLGLSIFGLVMGVLYIKTRTLLVPIVCHALNNLVAVSMGLLSTESNTTSTADSLEQLHSGWWFGAILMLIALPLLVRFLWQNWPRKDTLIPYLMNISVIES